MKLSERRKTTFSKLSPSTLEERELALLSNTQITKTQLEYSSRELQKLSWSIATSISMKTVKLKNSLNKRKNKLCRMSLQTLSQEAHTEHCWLLTLTTQSKNMRD